MKHLLETPTGRCDLWIDEPLEALLSCRPATRRLIVTDARVRDLHGARFPRDIPIHVIGQGEGAKSLETFARLADRLLDLEFDRHAFIVAIGGGVVCDVAAFAAATFMRGIGVGLVPTTLLAQADAGLGGKCGLNFGGRKNALGVVRQPDFCLCDPAFLSTLEARDRRSGLAEIVKMAAILDAAFFRFLEDHAEALARGDPGATARAVETSLRLKGAVVQADERELGPRRLLNFGHTFGHAFEMLGALRHGEAVALGMRLAADLSLRWTGLSREDAARLDALLDRLGLPARAQIGAFDSAAVAALVRGDKKRRGDRLDFVLLRALGVSEVEPLRLDELAAALEAAP